MADLYSTPGSAVSDTVQAILERRREMQRQMMLDRLNIEKFGADEEQRGLDNVRADKGLDLEGQRTGASVAADKARLENLLLERLPYGEADASQFDDQTRDVLRRSGRLRTDPGASVSVGTEFGEPGISDHHGPAMEEVSSTPSREMYTGSADFQKDKVGRDRIAAFIASNPEIFEGNDELKNILMMNAEGIDANIPAEVLGPPPSVTPIRQSGSAAPTITGERGTSFMELNPPPQPRAPIYIGIDEASGKPINQNADGTFSLGELPSGVRVGPKPSSGRAQDMIPGDIRNRLIASKNTPSLADDAQAAQVAISSARGVSENVKDAVRELYNEAIGLDPLGQPIPNWQPQTIEQILAAADWSAYDEIGSPLTPQEISQINDLLRAVLEAQ